MKKTIVFDFDGVIHSYKSGWEGLMSISDPPVDGIRGVLLELHQMGYEIVIVSTRSAKLEGEMAMKVWLEKNDIYFDRICSEKPPALVYVDDRAICFRGQTDTLVDEIVNFVPWKSK